MKNILKRLEAGRVLQHCAQPVLRFLTDLTYPRNCVGCEEPTSGGVVVCEACLDVSERILPPFCRVCGESFTGEMAVFFQCSNCGDRKFDFDFVVSAWHFKGTIRTMLLGLKYGKKSFLRRTLAELMMPVFDDERLAATRDDAWKIVPVPLNSRKFREREFNQAAEIAAILSKMSGYPVHDVLRRTRYTPSQARLTRKERMGNIEGAFELSRWARGFSMIKGSPVFLLDDIFTTGATAQECARVLKEEGGASRVVVLTVARG